MNTYVEGELIEDINGLWLWKTADGRQVPVELMSDTHLRNCASFLIGFGYRKCIASTEVRVVWLKILRTEWERRMLVRAERQRAIEAEREYNAQKELEENGRKQLR